MAAPVDQWVQQAANQMMAAGKLPLPGSEDPRYQSWLQKTGVNGQALDYDTYQAFRSGLRPDSRGHLNDTYKLPNHPTFSDESIHSGQNGQVGGKWVQTGPANSQMPEGEWEFQASPTNLENMSKDQLKQYFNQAEPGSSVVFPDGERYKGISDGR